MIPRNMMNTLPAGHHIPERLTLQWHITDQCNLGCTHCYQAEHPAEEAPDELPFAKLEEVVNQFKELLEFPLKYGLPPIKGQITVTGGEPFLRKDFADLLELFAKQEKYFSFAILSNGTLIDREFSKYLKEKRPRFVQISIDGTEETHERIRGKNNFFRSVAGIKCLVRERIQTHISFTAHKNNFTEIEAVAKIGANLKVHRVWADRLIPQGQADKHLVLTPEQTKEFFTLMNKARKKALFSRTEIAMRRALQFLVRGGPCYHCSAGDSLITIMPNGDLFPCRRLPILIGNVFETPLCTLYQENALMHRLRIQTEFDKACHPCEHMFHCRGGLKCLSYALYGDPFVADLGCWIQEKRQ